MKAKWWCRGGWGSDDWGDKSFWWSATTSTEVKKSEESQESPKPPENLVLSFLVLDFDFRRISKP